MPTEDKKQKALPQTTRDLLAQLSSEQFRGATSFRQLTPDQKLLWLVHAAAFALDAKHGGKR